MADAGEKLVLKPGVVTPFLSNFAMSNDGESFHFTELDMSSKNIEQLNKTIEEAKELCSKDKECMGITKQIMKSGKPKFTLRRFSKLSESTKPGIYTSWIKLE